MVDRSFSPTPKILNFAVRADAVLDPDGGIFRQRRSISTTFLPRNHKNGNE